MNSSTSKNKRSKQQNSTWTKTRLNETKTELKRQGKSVLKITFKILHNKSYPPVSILTTFWFLFINLSDQ